MLHPKKSLGQNFLIDKNIANKIVNLVNNIDKKNIIEVGPGIGALTEIILKKKPKKLILIEKDNYLFNRLFINYNKKKSIEFYNLDALKFNFKKINKPKSIIANLPYNISIKLLINWMKNISDFDEIVVMIQKEVAQKMNYNNSKKMNRLNVFTEITCKMKKEFDVSNNVFFPKPKIYSSVIKLSPKKISFDLTKLENFTKMLFRYKRKKLLNVLPKEIITVIKNKKDFININNIIHSRAEDLPLDKIIFLFKIFSQI